MRLGRRSIILALSALALSGASACKGSGSAGGAGNEIVIGHYASMTGNTAHFGQDTDKAVRMAVDEVNATRGPVEQIKRFALLPRDFSAEEGEITPTLKLKRRVCEAHFAGEIERLYKPGAR